MRLQTRNKVPALPVEVVERLLPLVPACTLLRARAVYRCVRPPCTQRPRRRCPIVRSAATVPSTAVRELPMGVVERLLALVPASTLVRWRAEWR